MQSFTPKQRSKLLSNRNVQAATEKTVTFTPDFKIKAVHLYLEGISPDQIFEDAGIPLNYFQDDYCRLCIKRWVEKFNSDGEDSLRLDERGRGATGRPPEDNLEDLTYDELLALVEIQQEALDDVRKQNALARKKKK